MGLFRSAMRLFRSGAGKDREEAAAELPEEQTPAAAELPEEHHQAAAELPDEQTEAVKAQPEVAPREVKHEARPNPDKPGWGLTIGQEIRKAREDRGSQE
jgi:Sec-independent protein translocase protein TatA